ncbi:MAG TPA: thioredoxin [Candidatus Aminicenantes bacterium]|nr:thioredoxin [Candidatus Aminicenantes bacterium]
MKPLTADTHDTALSTAETVVFDFSSPGCAPCRKVPALLESVIDELSLQDIQTYEINVSQVPELAARYMVLSVPTLIIFRNGTEIARFHSLPSRSKLRDALQ